jgi:hypothetical protein
MATAVVGYLAKDSINKGKQMASADLDKVKGDTINALKQLQTSIIYSLTDTETYALGQCLKQCQTKAKAMLAAYNASLQNADSADSNMGDSAPAAGGNKKKRKTKNTHRKGNKKYSKTKKYRR